MRRFLKSSDKLLHKLVKVFMGLTVVATWALWLLLDPGSTESTCCLICGLVLLPIIYINYIVAGYFYRIAVDKGYTDTVYLRITFFLPLIGQLLVIAMPNLKAASETKHSIDELPEI